MPAVQFTQKGGLVPRRCTSSVALDSSSSIAGETTSALNHKRFLRRVASIHSAFFPQIEMFAPITQTTATLLVSMAPVPDPTLPCFLVKRYRTVLRSYKPRQLRPATNTLGSQGMHSSHETQPAIIPAAQKYRLAYWPRFLILSALHQARTHPLTTHRTQIPLVTLTVALWRL